MSTLTLLPLIQVCDGVQSDEDWRLAIAFYLDDAVTPIDLTTLTFTLSVGSLATLSSGSGQINIAGPSSNVMSVAVLAGSKTSWPVGVYDLSLTVSDGVSTREIFAHSTLSVGSPQVARVSLIVAPDAIPRSIASPIPAALAQAFQALQPDSIVLALASMSPIQLAGLAQAIFSALPIQSGAGVPALTGQAFINISGYVVIAQ
jgi:hypothetical protein